MKKIFILLAMAFFIDASAQQYTKLLDFNGVNGKCPIGDLFSDGTYLYGMTDSSGTNDLGLIFKLKLDGTGYDTLHSFDGTNGGNPCGTLISDGIYLYGMTPSGGANGGGVIFKIKPDGTNYTNLHDFDNATGVAPFGSLSYDGTYLYGATFYGGSSSWGVLFKMKPDGTNYDTLMSFNQSYGMQATSGGSLIINGTTLYGTTFEGGLQNNGVTFGINNDGTNFSWLNAFSGADGSHPKGSLISDGIYLYGVTSFGGNPNGGTGEGTIYKVMLDGTNFSKLYAFTYNGIVPSSSLVSDGTYLYGMTTSGGSNNLGIIYKIKTDGTGYVKLLDFKGMNGGGPSGALILNGSDLFGMAFGGANNHGVIFKIKTMCTDIILNNNITICNGEGYMVGTHTYTNTGIYNDTLQTTLGCDSIIITHLTVNTSPTAIYTLVANTTPHIWDVTPSVSGGGILPYTYLWSWGDGTTDTLLYTSHTYTAAAHYNVCLTATDANGCSNQYCENDSLYRTSATNTMIQINVVNATSGINQTATNNNHLSVYPNPTSSILNVELNMQNSASEMQVTNMLGQTVKQLKIQNPSFKIDVSDLRSGVYYIRVGSSTQKFIKQ